MQTKFTYKLTTGMDTKLTPIGCHFTGTNELLKACQTEMICGLTTIFFIRCTHVSRSGQCTGQVLFLIRCTHVSRSSLISH